MAYIIYGAQPLMVKKQETRIINDIKEKFGQPDILYFDAKELLEDDLLYECNQYSLVSNSKIIFVQNSYFLSTDKTTTKLEPTNKLLNYLSKENETTILVFSFVSNSDINYKNKIASFIKENGYIRMCKDLEDKDWPIYIKEYFTRKNVKISDDAIEELIKRIDNNLNIFINEAQKLCCYKSDYISLNDVKAMISSPLSNNIFEIQNALLRNNKEKAISIFRDLKYQKLETVAIISRLSTSLMYLEKVLYLSSIGESNIEIAKETNSDSRRVMATLRNSSIKDLNRIRKSLDSLYNLDLDIKHLRVNPEFGFELFILNF